jgi:hypothetical protein
MRTDLKRQRKTLCVLFTCAVSLVVSAWPLAGCKACSARRAGPDPGASTLSILAAQSPACLKTEVSDAADHHLVPTGCAVRNGCLDPELQGGVCELSGGLIPGQGSASAPLDPAPPNAGFTANCLQTLWDTFSTKCARSLSLTPCLCGDDPGAVAPCLEGKTPPAGPVVPDYVSSFGVKRGSEINNAFTLPAYGAGMANGIVHCLAAFDCRCCFGLDGGADGGGC